MYFLEDILDDDELLSALAMKMSEGEELEHSGTPHDGNIPHSGRYPYGSGPNAFQRDFSFYAEVQKLRRQNISDNDIADVMHMNTREFRTAVSNAKLNIKKHYITKCRDLEKDGLSPAEIAKQTGLPDSTVRHYLDPSAEVRIKKTEETKTILREGIEKHRFIDIGVGIENHLGVTRDKLQKSYRALEEEGYKIFKFEEPQVNTGEKTRMLVLGDKDTTFAELMANRDKLGYLTKYSEDGGNSFHEITPPQPINLDRIVIKYAEDGGSGKDGIIGIRRGVEDLDLNKAHYAQVRVAVNETGVKDEDGRDVDLYLKGVAMYDDSEFPPGKDVIFYSSKHKDLPIEKVLKPMKDDPENPFGATIETDDEKLLLTQRHYTDKNGIERLSALNIVNEEGDWSTWSKTLSSQMLGKQKPELIKQQLDETTEIYESRLDEIRMLTNEAVKKDQLMDLADTLDGAAVNLKAVGLPGQASKLLLPLESIKPDECYCPTLADGTKVALVRFPHGSIVEIPVLVVNNKNKEGKSLIGPDAIDAIGIHHEAAASLSGADFDGDTALVIPLEGRAAKMQTSKNVEAGSELLDLKNFDPKERYPKTEGCKIMTEAQKQQEMGKVSNLITDMTIRGADGDEIAAAIRHSMVVIDAVKHELDYEQSYLDNHIAELKEKYQGGANKGASTLLSRATADMYINPRTKGEWRYDEEGHKTKVYIDPETGKKLWTENEEQYITQKTKNKKVPKLDKDGNPVLNSRGKPVMVDAKDKKGNKIKEPVFDEDGNPVMIEKERKQKIEKLAYYDDAFSPELNSGSVVETLYATYSNNLKAMANQCRKEALACEKLEYNADAAKEYAAEVKSLKGKLGVAKQNAPRERQAQLLANAEIRMKKHENKDMSADELKKVKNNALRNARERTGAGKKRVVFSDREWEAIQKGAISDNFFNELLRNANKQEVKKMAMPKETKGMSDRCVAKAEQMLKRGNTLKQVADYFDVSVTTLRNCVNVNYRE